MAKETWSGFKKTSALLLSSSMVIEDTFAGLKAQDMNNEVLLV